MGHGYRSNYTRRRFRMRYATTCKHPNTLGQVRDLFRKKKSMNV